MNYFINAQSFYVYYVEQELTLPDGLEVFVVRRVGDKYSAKVNKSKFGVTYIKANEEEKVAIESKREELDLIGRKATIHEILGIQPPQRRQRPQTGLDENSQAALDDLNNPDRQNQSKVGILYEPTEKDLFENMVLYPEAVKSVKTGINMIKKAEKIDELFGLSKIEQVKGRCIINFYGPPGTGKTASARCIAKMLGKKLYQVDYSQMISKWVGDTAKHIKEAFMEAKKHDAVLFWDEADSMMSKRIPMTDDGASNSINQNRNVLMQELDRFQGVVITTTNLFGNYDDALLRRIAQHVEFKLPNEEMRAKLIDQHLPIKDRVVCDLEQVAKATEGFSGGDILNLCRNSMFASANDNDDDNTWKITDEIMIAEAKKILDSKNSHGKGGGGKRGNIKLV